MPPHLIKVGAVLRVRGEVHQGGTAVVHDVVLQAAGLLGPVEQLCHEIACPHQRWERALGHLHLVYPEAGPPFIWNPGLRVAC